jgi:hypothetical protein
MVVDRSQDVEGVENTGIVQSAGAALGQIRGAAGCDGLVCGWEQGERGGCDSSGG